MEFVKRHWWLVVTLAAMVVLAGSAIALWVVFEKQMGRREVVLNKSLRFLQPTTVYYNDKAAERVEAATAYRQRQLDEIVTFVKQPDQWQPLIPGIFPNYQAFTQVLNFKLTYQAKIRQLMTDLGAVNPAADNLLAVEEATVFTSEKAFYKEAWIDEPTGPTDPAAIMQRLCQSQDDLWLMEDIVRAIRATNDEYFNAMKLPAEKRRVDQAVIKEVHRIEIGAQYMDLGFASAGRDRRYLTVSSGAPSYAAAAMGATADEPEVDMRARTLTGRASNNNGGTYKVLPFRLTVIADAGNYLELVRRLRGTRSCITVDRVRYEIVPETENAYRQAGLMYPNPNLTSRVERYGNRPLASVVITAESLIFQTPGARPTVLPKKTESTGGTGI